MLALRMRILTLFQLKKTSRSKYKLARFKITMASLASRVALVTGATTTGGIGYAVARALASKGSAVILNGLGEDNVVNECVESIKKDFNVPVKFMAADLSDATQVRYLAKDIIKEFPPGVDILVNNAGFLHVSHIERHSVEAWDRLIAVMLTAPFLLTKYLLPGMRRKGWGRIINMSSTHGVVGTPTKCGYSSAKHGLMGLTKSVAMDIAETGITCNSINPGPVDTPIYWETVDRFVKEKGITRDQAERDIMSRQPMKGLTTPEQIADTALFLCSPAADYITGTPIMMDGGWTAT